jgi:hypothetical protein
MGIILSFLPSIERNTMCCVNVTTRKTCWERTPTVQERYGGPFHHVATPSPIKTIDTDDRPANEVEFGAVIDVYAPVDTDRMLAEAHYDQILRNNGMAIN